MEENQVQTPAADKPLLFSGSFLCIVFFLTFFSVFGINWLSALLFAALSVSVIRHLCQNEPGKDLACTASALLLILWSVRQKKLKEAYAMLWVLIGVMLLGISLFPSVLRLISQYIGIFYPPATLFLLLLCGVITILFQYSLLLSRNQERISRLAQEVALLKNEIENLKKQK